MSGIKGHTRAGRLQGRRWTRRALLAGGSSLALWGCSRERDRDHQDSSIQRDNRASIAEARIPAGAPEPGASGQPFRIKFAPHFGMFDASAGPDLIEQIRFGAEQGFRAWEDNSLIGRSRRMQQRIAEALRAHAIEMGVFTIGSSAGYVRPSIATGDEGELQAFLAEIRERLPIARLLGAKYVMVNPGIADRTLGVNHQLTNVIEALRRAADLMARDDVTMVLEPTNSIGREQRVLQSMAAGYLVCKAVASPNLKLLFDVYQQQVMRGDIVNEIDDCWDEIAYFQIADHPGRAEPMTGEINYVNVLRYIRSRGYDGVIGMEHGLRDESAAGEQRMIATYRALEAAIYETGAGSAP